MPYITRMLFLSLLALAAGLASAAAASERIKSQDIEQRIIGRQVFLATPFGGEFPLNYRLGGKVDGSGEALGLGRFVKPNDSGRWWIEADRLCQKFTTWYDGAPMCFELYDISAKKLKWVRNNGETGTARIGARL